jgi:hypothetical protein
MVVPRAAAESGFMAREVLPRQKGSLSERRMGVIDVTAEAVGVAAA